MKRPEVYTMVDEDLVEVDGYRWNYFKIAGVCRQIGREFLERIDISGTEQEEFLEQFFRDIVNRSDDISPPIRLPETANAPYNGAFLMSLKGSPYKLQHSPYRYDRRNLIADTRGITLDEDFEFDGDLSLAFIGYEGFPGDNDAIAKQWEIEHFVRELPRNYRGLILSNVFADLLDEDSLLPRFLIGYINSIRFQRETYGIGSGKVRLGLREAI